MRGSVPLAVRAWIRYVVPLTVLAVIACAPILLIGSRAPAPPDLDQARRLIRVAWVLASFAWAFQLWLVAGVAPAVTSVASGSPLSQLRAFTGGLRGLVRGAIPVTISVIAIVLGCLALAVPGVILLVLLAQTGASDVLRSPPPAAQTDSIEVTRASWKRPAIVVIGVVVASLAITLAVQLTLVPHITRKVPAAKLLPVRTYLHVVALALTAASPLAACAIAALYRKKP
jgi:hypothetical protein